MAQPGGDDGPPGPPKKPHPFYPGYSKKVPGRKLPNRAPPEEPLHSTAPDHVTGFTSPPPRPRQVVGLDGRDLPTAEERRAEAQQNVIYASDTNPPIDPALLGPEVTSRLPPLSSVPLETQMTHEFQQRRAELTHEASRAAAEERQVLQARREEIRERLANKTEQQSSHMRQPSQSSQQSGSHSRQGSQSQQQQGRPAQPGSHSRQGSQSDQAQQGNRKCQGSQPGQYPRTE